MTTRNPDQLRWKVTEILYIALDASEQIAVELLGHREVLPDTAMLAEALRQADAQKLGAGHPDDAVRLAAQTAALAVKGRNDLIRKHVIDSISRHADRRLAHDITDEVMSGIGPVVDQAVASAADTVLASLADHPDWWHVMGAQAQAQTTSRITELTSFVRQIAGMKREGEPGDDGDPYDMGTDLDLDGIDDLIEQARRITGVPGLATGDADPNDEGQYRWNDHHKPNGSWCRWSHVSAPVNLAGSSDQRCPFDCPDSSIEPWPVAQAADL